MGAASLESLEHHTSRVQNLQSHGQHAVSATRSPGKAIRDFVTIGGNAKTMSRPLLANKSEDLQTGKSVDDILYEINSTPFFEEESSGSNHVVDLLQELEAVQIPTENPLLVPEPRPLEDLLQDLNRLEVPNFALKGEARTSDEDVEHAALFAALTARSQPSKPGWTGNTTQQLQTLDREGLLDLILFKLSGSLEKQPLLRKWSALDENISPFNVTSG